MKNINIFVKKFVNNKVTVRLNQSSRSESCGEITLLPFQCDGEFNVVDNIHLSSNVEITGDPFTLSVFKDDNLVGSISFYIISACKAKVYVETHQASLKTLYETKLILSRVQFLFQKTSYKRKLDMPNQISNKIKAVPSKPPENFLKVLQAMTYLQKKPNKNTKELLEIVSLHEMGASTSADGEFMESVIEFTEYALKLDSIKAALYDLSLIPK